MRIKRHSPPANTGDDHLIPLINVVFLMLIFFMLAGQIRASNGLPFMPPEVALPQAEVNARLVLLLTADNRMFLNDKPVQENRLNEVLASQLSDLGGEPSRYSLIIKIDQSLTAAEWRPVLAWAFEAGLDSVHLSTRRAGM